MNRILSPGKYVQGSQALAQLYAYVADLGKNGALAIVDPFVLEHYAAQLTQSFAGKKIPIYLEEFQGECSREEIDRLAVELEENAPDVIIGVGGGKTLDTAKAVAYYANLPVVICPTIASTDAPCSALSVLYRPDGAFDQYLFLKHNPDVVLVDTQIVVDAPVRLLVAGMGDALATYFEARSCIRANAPLGEDVYPTNAAYALSARCYEILLEDGEKAKLAAEKHMVTKAVDNIIEANTYLSGIGFESCGLAAAHAIHNGLTVLPETHSFVHGEKVAFGTLAQLVLENAPEDEIYTVLNFCKKVGLPTTLAQLGLGEASPAHIMQAAEAACASGETIHNMPFAVTPQAVCSAIFVADKLGEFA